MQIKRFEALNMAEALRMIKREFGPDAVILSAKNLKPGRKIFGTKKQALVEITAAIDNNYSSLEKGNYSQRTKIDYQDRPDMIDIQSSIRKKSITERFQDPFKAFKKITLHKEMKDGKRLDHERKSSILTEKFITQGMEKQPALELAGKINKKLPLNKIALDVDLQESLSGFFYKKHFVSKPFNIAESGRKIIALVGPTGMGKTTTIAKLAILYAVKMNKRVAVITLDNYRIGAVEQLGIYARISGIPMESVSSRDELMTALHSFQDYDLILIDTPGIGQREPDKLKELKQYFKNIDFLAIYLTLSASTQTADLLEMADNFKTIPIHSYLFTKLDESRFHGNIFNLLFTTKIPVSYFTIGQQVPDDICEASTDLLATLLLNKKKEERELLDREEVNVDRQADKFFPDHASDKYYVANRNSDIFHLPECKSVERIKQDNMIFFASMEEAKSRKFYPCRMCILEKAEKYNALYKPEYKKVIGGGLK
ncbi:MAG: flagellar biosynthesis protein FlhF [Desulfosarcina sp.]|nr:flagellar biosynthesis protein FlhF [Desulfobacterales bacterium]